MFIYPRRICGENLYHHIYAWGNDRHNIFTEISHYQKYLQLLKQSSQKYQIVVIAYALMQWHVHLFIFDPKNKISKFMEELHGKYAIFFNKETGKVGHVFGERYNNNIVQPNEYGLYLSRYIHRQAVEAGLVKDPEEYPWTSYRQYIGLEDIQFISPWIILEQFGDPVHNFKVVANLYKEFVLGDDNENYEINWDDNKNPIIGNLDFITEVKKSMGIKAKSPYTRDKIIQLVADELGVKPEWIISPKGQEQKKIRRAAINLLYTNHALKICEIAQILQLSRFTVMKWIEK
ncbi:MAG: transposase [candidate division WOR-3 bacterium]